MKIIKNILGITGLIGLSIIITGCTSLTGLIKQGEFGKALEIIENLDKEEQSEGYLALAEACFLSQDYEKAALYYEQAGKGPENYKKIADAYFKKKKYEEAVFYYDKAALDNEDYITIAQAFFSKKRVEETIKYYGKAGKTEEGYRYVADEYFEKGKISESALYYEKAGGEPQNYLKLAEAFLKSKQLYNAGTYFEKAGASPENYVTMADAYMTVENSITSDFPLSEIKSIAITKDDRTIISYSINTLMTLDILTGKTLDRLGKYEPRSAFVVLSSDERYVLLGGGYAKELAFYDRNEDKVLKTFGDKRGHIFALDLSRDNAHALVAGSHGVNVFDLKTGNKILTLPEHTKDIYSVAYTNDDKHILSGGNDGHIIQWNSETGEKIRTLSGHTDRITCMAVSDDNKFLVSGSRDKTIILWDLAKGSRLRTLKGHTGFVNDVVISLDNRYIVSGSNDSSTRLWDLDTGSLVQIVFRGHPQKQVNAVAISGNNEFVISGVYDYGDLVISRIKRLDHALDYYKKAGKEREGYIALATYYSDNEQLEKALDYFEKVGSDPGEYIKIAEQYLSRLRWRNAGEQIQRGVVLFEKYGKLEENLEKITEAYFQIKDYENAGIYAVKAKDEDWLVKIADKFFSLNNFERASYYYEKAGKGDEVSLKIAREAMKKKDYITAAANYEKAGVIADHYKELADGFFDKKDYENAAFYYEKTPDKKSAYKKLAGAFFSASDFDKAAVYYEKAESTKNDFLNLANGFFSVGQYDKAGKYYIKAGAFKSYYKKVADAFTAAGNKAKADIYNEQYRKEELLEFQINIPHLEKQAELALQKSEESFKNGNLDLSDTYRAIAGIYAARLKHENNIIVQIIRNTKALKKPAEIKAVNNLIGDSQFLSMARTIDQELDALMLDAEKGFVWDTQMHAVQTGAQIYNANALLLIFRVSFVINPDLASIPNMENELDVVTANINAVNEEIYRNGLFTRTKSFSNRGKTYLKQAEKTLDSFLKYL